MPDVGTRTCVHHWVLSVPDEDVVRGRCKRCGVSRDYPATVEGASRQGVFEEAASYSRSTAVSDSGGGRSRQT